MAEGTDNVSLQGGSSGEDTEVYSVDSYGTDPDYEMSAGSELESKGIFHNFYIQLYRKKG